MTNLLLLTEDINSLVLKRKELIIKETSLIKKRFDVEVDIRFFGCNILITIMTFSKNKKLLDKITFGDNQIEVYGNKDDCKNYEELIASLRQLLNKQISNEDEADYTMIYTQECDPDKIKEWYLDKTKTEKDLTDGEFLFLLDMLDFKLKKQELDNSINVYYLKDEQGGNLNEIEQDVFVQTIDKSFENIKEDIGDRLEIYMYDYFIKDEQE